MFLNVRASCVRFSSNQSILTKLNEQLPVCGFVVRNLPGKNGIN